MTEREKSEEEKQLKDHCLSIKDLIVTRSFADTCLDDLKVKQAKEEMT